MSRFTTAAFLAGVPRATVPYFELLTSHLPLRLGIVFALRAHYSLPLSTAPMLPAALADSRAASLTALVDIVDGDLAFVEAGERAAQALDVPQDRLMGRSARALGIPSTARAHWMESLLDAQQSGGFAQVELAHDTARESRHLILTATPLTDAPDRFACVIEDATQPWQAYDALANGGPALDTLTALDGGAALTYGPDLVVVAYGGAMPSGLVPREDGVALSLAGLSLYDLFPKSTADALALALLAPSDAPSSPIALPDGAHEVRARAVRDARGWPVAGLALIRPIDAALPAPAPSAEQAERDAVVAAGHARLRTEVHAMLAALDDTFSSAPSAEPLRVAGKALLDTMATVTFAREVLTSPAASAPIRLDALLQGLRPQLEAMTQARGLDLFLFVPDQPVWALGHRAHFGQALLGAVRYALSTTQRGAIRLALREEDERIAVQVADTGAGLSATVQRGIFAARSLEGLGVDALDLYAAQLLTEAMGGTVTARSEPQRGTLLTFALPTCAPPESSSLHDRHTAVLVEADPDTRALLDLFLRDAWETAPVESLDAAFEHATEYLSGTHVDALLLDLSGSLGEAESAIRRLRSTPMFDATFVVALVASAMPEERDRHLRLGYDAVLAKPFARQTLLEVLAPIKR
ncbi:MAG: ATP-binding protein [Bacteroidota bacterium]